MQSFFKKLYMTGDFWGGIAAMLVALPAAIAFGVTIYSAVAPSHAALGALAGIVGATVIGLIAVSYTHLRAHETVLDLVCRLLLEKKN